MNDKICVKDAVIAVKEAENHIESVQSGETSITNVQHIMNYAEQLLIDARVNPHNAEEKSQLIQAANLYKELEKVLDHSTHN